VFALLCLHAVVATAAPWLYPRFGRRIFWWCAVAPAATLVWLGWHLADIGRGEVLAESADWVPQLGLELSVRLDAFSTLMVALVAGIGTLVFVYSVSYFADHEEPKLGTLAAYLTAFAGSMFGLVIADNLYLLFVFWELTAVTSYLLIGYDDEQEPVRAAARQALLITGAGGLALLTGFVLLSQAAGTTSLHELLSDPPSGGVVQAALVLVVLGAATKSAQVPFHSWLPAAMAAPTPVSAYLHSATMVKAGIYVIARFAPAFAVEGVWRPLVITIGLVTMLTGAVRALRQHDLKLLLAFGTVSQLGFMFVLFGTGAPGATEAGAALLLAHALFKSALFLTTGVIDHQVHSRDIRRLDGVGRRFPVLAAGAVVAAASMAGIIPLFGFVAKEYAFEAYLHGALSGIADTVVLVVLVAGSALTVAYSFRYCWGAFASKHPPTEQDDEVRAGTLRSPLFVAPVVVLSVLTIAFGLVPSLADVLVVDGAIALDPLVSSASLKLWSGPTTALLLSGVTLTIGAFLVMGRRRVEWLQGALPSVPGSDGAYQASLRGLVYLADRVTGVVQNGSLPVYLAVITLTVLVLPGTALAASMTWPDGVELAESPVQAAVVAMLLVAAVAVAVSRRRFVAVLLVGAVGYGVATLFVIQGGPDLALTQLLVETLTVVVFVLVLRHLPEKFPNQPWRFVKLGRAGVAAAVGAFVTVFTVVAAGARRDASVAGELAERSLPEGGGRNVVNVILTDFRALDTLGEIAVLAVAALGITSLLAAGRRARRTTNEGAQ
jgi:multicomponent Na+:H+ antiporter subunit A